MGISALLSFLKRHARKTKHEHHVEHGVENQHDRGGGVRLERSPGAGEISQRTRRWIHKEYDIRRARISRRCHWSYRNDLPSGLQRWGRGGCCIRLARRVHLVELNRGETRVYRENETHRAEN